MAENIKQYVPEFYERDFGKSNIVSHTVDVFEQICNDIKTEKFNDLTDAESIKKEFKVADVIVSGFSIRDISFLKAFFAFKGTNLDLKYILNNIGYESVIYNDGGYVHRNLDGTERVIPINPFYGDKLTEPKCQIEIKVIINLNRDDSMFGGYTGLDLAKIRAICQERLNSCSYLSRVFIEISAKDTYPTMKWMSDYFVAEKYFAPFKDLYFKEYRLPEVIYGEEFNDRLRYGKEFNDSLAYGRHNQILFKPLSDKLILGMTHKLPESALSINGENDSTIQLNEELEIISIKPQYDTYPFAMVDRLDIKAKRVMWLKDENEYPTVDIKEDLTVGRGKKYQFIENPNAYFYGREYNANLKYGDTRGDDEFGDESEEVIAYGEQPKNQGTEHPLLSINGSNKDAVIDMQDSLTIQVIKSKK